MQLNNQNVFQQRASQRNAEKFANVIPQEAQSNPETQSILIEDEQEKPQGNIFQQHAKKNRSKESEKFGFLDTLKDIGEQVLSKGIAGVGGSYGNLLDTFGLQLKPGETLPGQEAANSAQFQVLQKLERGEVPSFGEFMLLSDDDEFLPRAARLPTSKELQGNIQDITGVGEGKTPAGRIAGRGAEFVGEGLAVPGGGVKSLIGLGLSGVTGQGIREGGGPEALATGVEIGGSLVPSIVSGKVSPVGITRSGKEAKRLTEAGRHVGLTEKQIAPLIQGENKSLILSKAARKGTRTKRAFASIKESLGEAYNSVKTSPEAKVKLANAEQINLRKQFGNIRNDLSKTLAPSPEKEAALNYIEKALDTLRNIEVTPEHLVNFWQDINKSVKWNSIEGGKKALARLKKPISETLQKTTPELAKDFEMINDLYSKYAQISKKLKPNLVDAFVNKGEIIAGTTGALALATGNPWLLTGVLAEGASRVLAREMLINPYFQNLATKLVTNFNSGSIKAVQELTKQAQDYMMKKHPQEDWSFLTDY